jgi:hypothetical protein
MAKGLYRVYTKGDGYVEPIRKWAFVAGFVDKDDALEWVAFEENKLPVGVYDSDADIEFKIMRNGKNVLR